MLIKLKIKLLHSIGKVLSFLFPKTIARLNKLDALRMQYHLRRRELTLCAASKVRLNTSELYLIKYEYNSLRFFWMERLK